MTDLQTNCDLSESVHVAASPHRVYALVSDLQRMGSWSPECTGVTWRGDLAAPVVGARFVGHNRHGRLRWSTSGEVMVAEPGRCFAFEVTVGPVKVARWSYRMETSEGDEHCVLTEQWTDRRPAVVRVAMDRALGSRAAGNAKGMRITLQRLKQAAESSAEI